MVTPAVRQATADIFQNDLHVGSRPIIECVHLSKPLEESGRDNAAAPDFRGRIPPKGGRYRPETRLKQRFGRILPAFHRVHGLIWLHYVMASA
jgi:hypothetical protein